MLKAVAVCLGGLLAVWGTHSVMSGSDSNSGHRRDDGSVRKSMLSSQIYPTMGYTNNTLQVKMENAIKSEYDQVAVTWYRNGTAIDDYTELELTPDFFEKGDEVHAQVNLLGSEAPDDSVVTASVHVLNTPPRIIETSVNLRRDVSDVIYSRVNSVDADGDAISYRYQWFKNGIEVDGANRSTFDLGLCRAGDEVYAVIIASDGEDESPPERSEPIRIGSGAPQILSTPPQSLANNRRFVYQLSTTEVSPQNLTYELLEAPQGMSISRQGRIDWELPGPQAGTQRYEVVVRVTNSHGGEAYQEFSIATAGTVGD